ncbi:PQ-loop-domain-containing protein, partial [Schizopora paradoxa]
LGWVSIACWIVVYTPQIYENYQLKSGEGLSVLFVVIWLLGDLCNLVGALMAGLQATVVIIAVYYSLCDSILLFQIYYYRHTHPVHLESSTPAVTVSNEHGEESPLLTSEIANRRKSSSHPSYAAATLRYLLAFTFVICTGIIAWLASQRGNYEEEPKKAIDVIEWKSQVIGWTSAILYLGSRIPQIFKNFKTKCEGLSLALFMFAIAGNVTYVLSICTKSMERKHYIANASWLAGHGLTVFLDIFVLCQFFYFRSAEGRFVSEPPSRSDDA